MAEADRKLTFFPQDLSLPLVRLSSLSDAGRVRRSLATHQRPPGLQTAPVLRVPVVSRMATTTNRRVLLACWHPLLLSFSCVHTFPAGSADAS